MKLKRLLSALAVGGAFAVGGCGQAEFPTCFVRGTRVLVPRGRRRIEELRVGDEVMSWSFAEDRPVVRTVSRLLPSTATSLLRLRAGELAIEGVTASHPFYDMVTRRWVVAGELDAATRLCVWLGEGDPRELPARIERLEVAPTEVHNLSVAGDEQNYFAEGLLVHNKSPDLAAPADSSVITTCFLPGTRVMVPGGRRAIEELRVGDEVMSWSLADGRALARPVRKLIAGHAEELLRLRVGELAIAGVTASHPFYDAAVGQWRPAGELDGDSRLLVWLGAGEARPLPVAVERYQTASVAVHNLSIGGAEQNYFAEGLLVHNKSPDLAGYDWTTPADATEVPDGGVGDGGDGGD